MGMQLLEFHFVRLREINLRAVLQNLNNVLSTPYLNYCILCRASVINETHSLHILQKIVLVWQRSERQIINISYISNTQPLCKELRALKISNIIFITYSIDALLLIHAQKLY